MKLRNKNLSLIALLTGALSYGSFEKSFAMDETFVKEKAIDVKLDLEKPEGTLEDKPDQGRKMESDKKSDVRKTEEQEQIQAKAKNEPIWDGPSFKVVGKTEGHLHFEGSGIGREIFCDVDKNAQTVSTNSLGVLTELVFRRPKEEKNYSTLEITLPKDKASDLDQLFSRKLINKFNFQQNVTTGDLTGRDSGDQIAPALDEISARRAELPGGHKESFGVTYKLTNPSFEVSDEMEDILTSKEFQKNIQMREFYDVKIRPLILESLQISGGQFLGSKIEIDYPNPKEMKDRFNRFPGDFPHDEDFQVSVSDKDEMMAMTSGKFIDLRNVGILKGKKTEYFITMNANDIMYDSLKKDYDFDGIFVEGGRKVFLEVGPEEMEKFANDPRFSDLGGIVSAVFNDEWSYQGAKEFLKDKLINSSGEGESPQ